MQPIVERLKQEMDSRNLNANQLSSLLGYANPEKIYRLFRTETAMPSAEILLDISNTLEGLDLNWFLTGKRTNTPSTSVSKNANKKSKEQTPGIASDGSVPEIVPPTVPPTRKKAQIVAESEAPLNSEIPSNIEPMFLGSDDMKAIPLVDIRTAAGQGYMNPAHMDVEGYISVPKNLISRGFHLAVRNKGESMAPTIQDSSVLVIRLFERNEWADMPDEEIFVVNTRDGASYVKRVKNRWERGFIVLMSDNPDKASHPNFNLKEDEIHTIWHLDCTMGFRFPNIHNQYYSRLKQLEDSVEEIRDLLKLNERNKVYPLA